MDFLDNVIFNLVNPVAELGLIIGLIVIIAVAFGWIRSGRQ
jgi:hypothetical protein